jgi:hypothetical protein
MSLTYYLAAAIDHEKQIPFDMKGKILVELTS